jgi:hypothetical protein
VRKTFSHVNLFLQEKPANTVQHFQGHAQETRSLQE